MALRNNQRPQVPPSGNAGRARRGDTQAYPPAAGRGYRRDGFVDPCEPYGYADPYTQQAPYGYADPYAGQAYDPRAGRYRQPYPNQQCDPNSRHAAPGRAVGYEPLPYAYGAHRGPAPEPPRKKGSATVVVAILLLVVGLGLLVGAGVVWLNSQRAYDMNAAEYHELASANVTEDTASGRPIVDFAALTAQNPEIVGWIQIPGTAVNYPVCQTGNNDYYLNHSFLGRDDDFGAIFMDYRSSSDLSSRNTVVYGHHLQNGEMLAQVAAYSDQAAFDTLKNIYYVTPDGQVHVLAPLCCMVVDGYDVDSIQFDFADQASFEAYVQSLIDRSSARSATATSIGVERVYMLSTCSYEHENDRTILVCVDLNATNGPVMDATQSMNDIQAAADQAAGIA